MTEESPEAGAMSGFTGRLRTAIGDDTLRVFAGKAGISTSALHQYLTGKSEPSRPVLLALARAGDVRLDWLAGAEAGPEPTVRESAPPYTPAPAKQVSAEFDPFLLETVLATVEQVLHDKGIVLAAGKKSRFTSLVYEDTWRRGGTVDREYAEKLAELAG